ncbi:MAG TPA: hypothetical protein VN947_08265 [Polyangia bacterium]|nr:hypothetical protein [Polyangia bacterium]
MSGKLVQEEDRIATGKIVATAVISLLIFGVGVIWAISIQRATAENHSVITPLNSAPPAEKGAPEVGIVYQWPFDVSQYGADKKAEAEARLHHYSWVDKDAKIVRIPIDEAMQKYVSQAGGGK